MTHHKLYTALTWFLPLLQLLVGTGMAQGAVICIAPEGHFAIETPYAKTDCLAAHKNFRPTPLGWTLENSAPKTCWDTPIFAAGSHLTMSPSVETVPPASYLESFLSPPTVVTQDGPSPLSHVISPALRSTLHVLRSIVLLI